ncbi:MAG: DHA2 family efflux MFS transporter permease subunit, partial [Marmoricola sp.]
MAQTTQPPAQPTPAAGAESSTDVNPWPALFALCLGFFMILVDSTIVSVATPAIIADLQADVNDVVWVTSAYLLAYAVPVLITGRLGDRFGPKNLYMLGLTVFTLSSLWCGLTGSIEGLIVARVFQGLGAAMITPQTMAIITRIFPSERRGQAMALWGATAGVATLVGPILGGVLVDTLGWEWIFFINIPVGVIGLVLAWRLVPTLSTNNHRFDWLGVALSGVAMFMLVFGIQEGHQFHWGTITGLISVPLLIIGGVVFFGLFVLWQARNTREPLVPLSLFRDRNFSLANVAISSMACAITAMAFPIMLYAQLVRDLSPTGSALLLVPMALMSILLAPVVGKLTDSIHPRIITSIGFAAASTSLVWLSLVMTPDSATWEILLPMTLLGIGNAGVWAPTSATATRNLPMHRAGAGAGVYNATRQVGAVLGSAAIAVLMDSRLEAQGLNFSPSEAGGGNLPQQVFAPFSEAMSQAML